MPGSTFQPPSSEGIGQALGTDPLTDALSARHNEALTQAFTRLGQAYRNAVVAYRKVAAAEPNDAAVQFELAQTAEAASDLPTAIAAYKRFVRLAPEDPTAGAVRERIKQLESQPGS